MVSKMTAFGSNIKYYDVFDVLADMARSISLSKYADKIVFRGGFSLIAAMHQKGVDNMFRETTDINLDWITSDCWDEFYANLLGLLTGGSDIGGVYTFKDERNPRQQVGMKFRLVCSLANQDKIEVAMDMSERETLDLTTFKVPRIGIDIVAGSIYEMLCDKLSVFATQSLGGRIKDFYDLYIISFMPGLEKDKILSLWRQLKYEIKGPIFGMTPGNFGRMKKPFDMLALNRFNNEKFEDVLGRVIDFVHDLYTEFVGFDSDGNNWNVEKRMWM